MKKIRVGNGYVTDVEMSCGEITKIDVDIDKQPVSFSESDAELIKSKLVEHYKNKDVVVEIVIENI